MDADGLRKEISGKIYDVRRLITNIEELLEEKKYDKYIPKEVKIFVEYLEDYINFSDTVFTYVKQTSEVSNLIPVLTNALGLLDTYKESFFSLPRWPPKIPHLWPLENPPPRAHA